MQPEAGDPAALLRIRHTRGFAIYLANTDSYQGSVLPTGYLADTRKEALDCDA